MKMLLPVSIQHCRYDYWEGLIIRNADSLPMVEGSLARFSLELQGYQQQYRTGVQVMSQNSVTMWQGWCEQHGIKIGALNADLMPSVMTLATEELTAYIAAEQKLIASKEKATKRMTGALHRAFELMGTNAAPREAILALALAELKTAPTDYLQVVSQLKDLVKVSNLNGGAFRIGGAPAHLLLRFADAKGNALEGQVTKGDPIPQRLPGDLKKAGMTRENFLAAIKELGAKVDGGKIISTQVTRSQLDSWWKVHQKA
jgi:hypothetical protein